MNFKVVKVGNLIKQANESTGWQIDWRMDLRCHVTCLLINIGTIKWDKLKLYAERKGSYEVNLSTLQRVVFRVLSNSRTSVVDVDRRRIFKVQFEFSCASRMNCEVVNIPRRRQRKGRRLYRLAMFARRIQTKWNLSRAFLSRGHCWCSSTIERFNKLSVYFAPTQQQLRCIQDIFEFHLDDDNVKTNEHEWKIKLGQDGNQELSYQPLSPQLEAKTRLGNHITSAQLFGLAITFHLTILVGWKWNLMMTRMEKLMPELLSAIKWPLALTHVRTSPRTDITFN